jgi:hypothetical protein
MQIVNYGGHDKMDETHHRRFGRTPAARIEALRIALLLRKYGGYREVA